MLNFVITPLGLEDQLLGLVAAKEKPALEQKKNELIMESARNRRQLKEIEDKILQVLSSSQVIWLRAKTLILLCSQNFSLSFLQKALEVKEQWSSVNQKLAVTTNLHLRPIVEHSNEQQAAQQVWSVQKRNW